MMLRIRWVPDFGTELRNRGAFNGSCAKVAFSSLRLSALADIFGIDLCPHLNTLTLNDMPYWRFGQFVVVNESPHEVGALQSPDHCSNN